MKISVLFVGELHDSGFNQCALEGVEQLQDPDIEIISGIPYNIDEMTLALREAAKCSKGVVFVGGQGNQVTPNVANIYPNRCFAIVQGNVTGANFASYDVLQEQSAFLAGVLAARMTKTGTVGHLSGHRVTPGLKGRAAFAAGVRHADSTVRLVTGFCGTQDDSTVTEAWTRAIVAEDADILFTMLNAARDGATRACRATGIRQIGNATDWCLIDPDTFVGSAVARIDRGVIRAVSDMRNGVRPREVVQLGLRESAVGLSTASDVKDEIQAEIAVVEHEIAGRKVSVEVSYDGPEFEAVA